MIRIITYIVLFFILTSCIIHEKYDSYHVKTYDGKSWETVNQGTEDTYVKVNLTTKKIKTKYLGKKFKYDIDEYRYMYPRFTIFKFRKDAIGIRAVTKNGYMFSVYYDSRAYLDIPKFDNCDLSDTLIYYRK